MGHISSKLLKLVKECEDKTSEPHKDAVEDEDPKSSTKPGTPVVTEKLTLQTEENIAQESDLLKTKLLRTLKLDPRSPTVGIYRTPILVEDSNFYKTIPNNSDSPVSIYSCNINDSLVQDVMTPAEPSVNVSDFEHTQQILNELDNTLEPEEIIEAERKTKGLRISDKPNTYEARRLLDEIIMSDEENFLKKVKMPSKRNKKIEVRVSEEKKISEVKGQIKNRLPLSNITSSANSPNKAVPNGKIFSQNKIVPDLGVENSASPKVKHIAQWDQNNTVII